MRSNFTYQDLDPSLLMWDVRRLARADRLSTGRTVIEFEFIDQPGAQRRWWLLKEPNAAAIDLCLHDPGYEVDLFVRAELETMTRVWMGDLDMAAALRAR